MHSLSTSQSSGSQLRLGTITLPAAHLGGESPLPPLGAIRTASDVVRAATAFPHADHGMESCILPYRSQQDYNRKRAPRQLRTVELENQYLRATFLLDLGGRLWSLVHKPSNTELLDSNDIFQPTNVALRGAWISGGVEWNISIIGHTVFTLDALFAGVVKGDSPHLPERPDGCSAQMGTVPFYGPVLRFWEFDRVRQVVFQIDAWLPPDSKFLFVRPRIVNTRDQTVAMYWWSNIAVKEGPDVRVLAPATDGFRHNYDGKIVPQALPVNDGVDCTYTSRRDYAADLYYRIPQAQRPWIAALNGRGRGLVQASTSRLCGRKLWNWGTLPGGRRWQAFLEGEGTPGYIEIQGGLTPTQSEYLPMPSGQTWDWLEAYGLMEADATKVHGGWREATREVDQRLQAALPAEWMEQELERTRPLAERPPERILREGSGWGALEEMRRRHCSRGLPTAGRTQESPATEATPFPQSSLGEQQAPWMRLLSEGELPYRPATEDPGSLMVQKHFHELLERAVGAGRGNHWLSWYHLGIMRLRADDQAGAKQAFEKSIELEPSAWAYRNLGVLAKLENDGDAAIGWYFKAVALCPDLPQLAGEACQAIDLAGLFDDLPALLDLLGPAARTNPRVRYYEAHARLEQGDLEFVRQFLDAKVVMPDVKEGEAVMTRLWFGYHEKRLARDEGVALDDALAARVRREFPPPLELDWRIFNTPC